MNFESRITATSSLPGFEDVKYTLHKMTEGRRIKLRLSMVEPVAELTRLLREAGELSREEKPDIARINALVDQSQILTEDKIDVAWVRWGLKSIEGLEIDGKPATPDSLIEDGPRELYREIATRIKAEADLTETQKGESGLPSISGELADGQTKTTSADSAASQV